MYWPGAAWMAGVVATLTTTAPVSASRQAVNGPRLVVDVVHEAGVAPNILKTGQVHLTEIYGAIGVVVKWVNTPAGGPEVVILKIVRDDKAGRLKAPAHSLGSLSRVRGGPGRFAYVFYDRVDIVSRRNRLDAAAVLGAAVAHELAPDQEGLGLRHLRANPM